MKKKTKRRIWWCVAGAAAVAGAAWLVLRNREDDDGDAALPKGSEGADGDVYRKVLTNTDLGKSKSDFVGLQLKTDAKGHFVDIPKGELNPKVPVIVATPSGDAAIGDLTHYNGAVVGGGTAERLDVVGPDVAKVLTESDLKTGDTVELRKAA